MLAPGAPIAGRRSESPGRHAAHCPDTSGVNGVSRSRSARTRLWRAVGRGASGLAAGDEECDPEAGADLPSALALPDRWRPVRGRGVCAGQGWLTARWPTPIDIRRHKFTAVDLAALGGAPGSAICRLILTSTAAPLKAIIAANEVAPEAPRSLRTAGRPTSGGYSHPGQWLIRWNRATSGPARSRFATSTPHTITTPSPAAATSTPARLC